MGMTNDMHMLMRLSYDQAEGDYADKKTDNIVEAYKKYHKINLKYDCFDPVAEVEMFHNENYQDAINFY
jgi:hypothetical protein|tara:strand:+ start:1262 stop:1468 length:207 start_codon:yes stop_codon:yes gene_type:complete